MTQPAFGVATVSFASAFTPAFGVTARMPAFDYSQEAGGEHSALCPDPSSAWTSMLAHLPSSDEMLLELFMKLLD